MSKSKKIITPGGSALLLTIIVLVVAFGFSWILTCGVIKLITLCFGWQFKWSIATGIWLVMCLARTVFKNNSSSK